jgi:hypothetical protein
MFHLDTLREHDLIEGTVHDYLRRRVDQIIEGLEQLITMPAHQWLSLRLPALEPEAGEKREDSGAPRWQGILARVAQVTRSFMPAPIPPRNGQPPPTKGTA